MVKSVTFHMKDGMTRKWRKMWRLGNVSRNNANYNGSALETAEETSEFVGLYTERDYFMGQFLPILADKRLRKL